MRDVSLTDEEVIILHHLMITEMSLNHTGILPECTWQDECTSCNLMDKMYRLWSEVQDG